jgi:hypothetical protein
MVLFLVMPIMLLLGFSYRNRSEKHSSSNYQISHHVAVIPIQGVTSSPASLSKVIPYANDIGNWDGKVQEYHIQHHFLFIEYSAEYCLNIEQHGNFA